MRVSSAQVKFYQIPYVNFEMTSRFLSTFYIPLQFHERKLLYTFLAQTIYTFLKGIPLKWKFFRPSSPHVKFCQIPFVNLKRRVYSFTNFVSLYSFMKDNHSILFLAQAIYTLLKRSPLKWTFSRLLSAQVKFYQIPYINLKLRVHSCTNFLSLFSFTKDNSSILF